MGGGGAGEGEEDLGEWREQGRERKTWVSGGSRGGRGRPG